MQTRTDLARIRSSGATAVICAAAALLNLSALAATIDVTDIAGRTVTVKKGVERVILGERRMIHSLAVLDRENPFGRVIGWRADLIKYDPDAWRKYEERFPGARDVANFGSPCSGEFSVEKATSLETDLVLWLMPPHHTRPSVRSVPPSPCHPVPRLRTIPRQRGCSDRPGLRLPNGHAICRSLASWSSRA